MSRTLILPPQAKAFNKTICDVTFRPHFIICGCLMCDIPEVEVWLQFGNLNFYENRKHCNYIKKYFKKLAKSFTLANIWWRHVAVLQKLTQPQKNLQNHSLWLLLFIKLLGSSLPNQYKNWQQSLKDNTSFCLKSRPLENGKVDSLRPRPLSKAFFVRVQLF